MEHLYNFLKSNNKLWRFFKSTILLIRYLKSTNLLTITNPKVQASPVINISNKGHHCFFGYYDKTPWNSSMSKILYNSVSNDHKDILNVCVFDLKSQESLVLDQTLAWNWQQGTMLQWITNNEIIFNSFDSSQNKYFGKRINIDTGKSIDYQLPIYAKGKCSSKYLSLNFDRLHTYAKGYGYSAKLPHILNDTEDGIWELDMNTNTVELILTIDAVKKINHKPEFDNSLHYINHVEYFALDTKCIFIHRWFQKNCAFCSRLIVFDILTNDSKVLLDNNLVSHYCWKDEITLFLFATDSNLQTGYFEIDTKTGKTSGIFDSMPLFDGHPSFSPDQKYILTDSYPDFQRLQSLFVYNVDNKKLTLINKLYTPIKYFDEKRCDLHPRWSPDGKFIAVDTTYSGLRTLSIFKI